MLINSIEGKNRRKTLIIPMDAIPMSANKTIRSHWKTRTLEVEKWATLISASLHPSDRLALRKNAQKSSPAIVMVNSVFLHRKGAFDPDNAVAALKLPLDGLVHAGLLRDDSEKYVKIEMPKQPTQCGPGFILILTWTEKRG